MNNAPSVEERIWAVIAHLSALAMGMGLLLPIVGWSEYRRKSNYTSFQCLQALGYQSLGYTIWILAALVVVVITSVGSVAGFMNAGSFETAMMTFMTAHIMIMLGLMGIYFILPIIAAIACAFGKDFRYPLMGNKLARYLGYETLQSDETGWLNEEHEDRWVASMGHFSVIVMLWGMLAPVTAWLMQGKRSRFLKFQSIQAFVFQAVTLVLYFGSGLFVFGGSLFFLLSTGMTDSAGMDSSAGMIGALVFLISLLCTSAVVLIIPLLHIMGQWAGYRILKGDDYRYPIIGKLIERRLSKNVKSTNEELPA